MTNPFEDFIQSEEFHLNDDKKATCATVHPFVGAVMKDYYSQRPVEEMVCELQAQIAACTATEFVNILYRSYEDSFGEESADALSEDIDDIISVVKNAIAVAFATWNTIDKEMFDDSQTTCPGQ